MPSKVIHYAAKMAPMQGKPNVVIASNGTPYIDVSGPGFYPGVHKRVPYSRQDMVSLQSTFRTPTEELRGEVPVMIDHSKSNHDKIGHLRAVTTSANGTSQTVLRLVGQAAIDAYNEGKLWQTSAGIGFAGEPVVYRHSDGSFVGECPKCGADIAEDDDDVCPDCGAEVDDDGEPVDGESYFDEGGEEASYSDTMPGQQCAVSYDHIAFVPFPALTNCKIHKRSQKKMPDPIKKPVIIANEADKKALLEYAAQCERERDEAKADAATQVAEAKAEAAREVKATRIVEENIRAGRVTPAERDALIAHISHQSDAGIKFLGEFLANRPKIVPLGEAIGKQEAIQGQDDKPLQSNHGKTADPATRGHELLLKYSTAGAHAQQRKRILQQAKDAEAAAILGVK